MFVPIKKANRYLLEWWVVERMRPDVGELNEQSSSTVYIGVLLYCSHWVQQVPFVICDGTISNINCNFL